MTDDEIQAEIGQLEQEREVLHQREPSDRSDPGALDADRDRLRAIEERLDQLWDELRQRRALRDAGKDPDAASVRPVDAVERYQQ
jgi:hypothetical protein